MALLQTQVELATAPAAPPQTSAAATATATAAASNNGNDDNDDEGDDGGGPMASAFVLSAIWAWECPSHRGDMVCVYPNSTDPKEAGSNTMAAAIRAANEQMHSLLQPAAALS
jgi:hypothetical protein